MRVFVTGGTGYVGSRVVRALAARGHSVIAAVRNDAARKKLADMQLPAGPFSASLDDVASLADGAKTADAVVHVAFDHTVLEPAAGIAKDDAAVSALVDAYAASGKALIATTATGMMGNTGDIPMEEDFLGEQNVAVGKRRYTETMLARGAEQGVRTISIRVPILTHDEIGKGVLPRLIDGAKRGGVPGYLGEGANCVPVVHVEDLGELYALALEKAKPGSVYNGVADLVSTKALAQAIGAGLGVPARSITSEQASDLWGPFYSRLLSLNNRLSGRRARDEFGWKPYAHTPSLLDDVQAMTRRAGS